MRALRRTLELVKADIAQGAQLKIGGTPTFFMNGMRLPGLRGEIFDAAIAWEFEAGRRKQRQKIDDCRDRNRQPDQGFSRRLLAAAAVSRAGRADTQVEPGEVFGFLGPNGAGKSTTLKLLMQLIYPTRGRARILGRPVGDVAVRRRIGFLAENPYFYDYLTAEEVLTYFAQLFGCRGADVHTRVVARARRSRHRRTSAGMRLRQFSKGMLQRVGLAQAIINDPEVVFLDEPMSGLDPLGRRHVRDLILRLREGACTVFFSSHILSDAETLCSRVGIMAQGRLVASGRVSELVAFELKGWELVVAGVRDDVARRLARASRGIAPLAHGRFTIDLAPDVKPERLMAELSSRGATRRVAQSGARHARRLLPAAGAAAHEPRQARSVHARDSLSLPAPCFANRFAIACRTAWWCSRCC